MHLRLHTRLVYSTGLVVAFMLGIFLSCNFETVVIPSRLSTSWKEFKNDLAQLREVVVMLHKAHRYARSGRTRLFIEKSLQLLYKIEPGDLMVQPKLLHDFDQSEVCSEYWDTSVRSNTWLQDIYKTKPCNRTALERLIQIVLYMETCKSARHLMQRIHAVYPAIKIYLAVKEAQNAHESCSELPTGRTLFQAVEDAKIWVQLVSRVESKYVLIGRNMVDFTPYTDLDRLLRAKHQLKADIVGGSVRLEPDGQWFAGCYQAVVKNFTIRIQPGHDISSHSCAYCDYLASPFLIESMFFLKYMRQSTMHGPMIPFVDLFLRLAYPQDSDIHQGLAIACVDVLFHVTGHQSDRGYGLTETGRTEWTHLAKQWTVNRVQLDKFVDHQWTCDEVAIKCETFMRGGVILPGCCLNELAHCSKAFLNLTAANNVWTCTFSGNVVAAIKLLGAFLPWERDSDFGWDARKHSTILGPIRRKLENESKCKLGPTVYYTDFKEDVDKCSNVTTKSCFYHALYSTNWRIQLYGEPVSMHRDYLYGLNNATLINVDGIWTATYPNPGYAMRGLYGDNILGHIQHWLDYGEKNGWTTYSNVEWAPPLKCPTDVPRHACFHGNYLPVGNLQFQDSPI